jgi:tRNA G26 N,N-dimethylase Trm1
MQDNSDLQAKILLRSRYIDRLPTGFSVVDFYAGEGVISGMFWACNASKVICVEKDPRKAARIKKSKNIEVFIGDNIGFLYLAQGADVFDCDAYGLVMPFLKKLAQSGGSGKRVFFTDGTPLKAKRVFSAYSSFKMDCEKLFKEYELIESNQANVIYGTGVLR